jgi:hypothetical protein
MKRRHGFTLPQLLATLAVGSLLIATVLPTLESDRENLRRAICANNLRQIGQGMIMYSDDFRGYFPMGGRITSDLGPSSGPFMTSDIGVAGGGANNAVQGIVCYARYLVKHHYLASPTVLVCPSDRVTGSSLTPVFPATAWQTIEWNNISYFYIVKMGTQWPTLSGAATTNRFYMLMADRANQASDVTPDLTAADNHGTDGRNVLYTDSHVEWKNGVTVNDLYSLIGKDWGLEGVGPPSSPQVVGQQP